MLLVGLLGIGTSLALAPFAVAQDAAAVAPANEAASEVPDDEVTETVISEGGVTEVSDADSMSYTINTLIMMICAVLVLFMQAGFAMLEVGLNAAKNTVNILAKNILDLGVGVILFLVLGYGLMYPGEDYAGGYFGYAGPGVTRDADAPNLDTGFSNSADFLFQVAFAATAATIVSGAVAGRMKFAGYLVYSAFLTGLIYPISGMWKWGGGFLAEAGFQDFAGSVVVHAVGGFAALAGAWILGPRLGRFTKDGKSVPMPGHNITFAALGVFILWVGWYGFNPGSQLTYSGWSNAEATTYIAFTTTLAAAAGSVAALLTAWVVFGKPDVTMALNGVLAGLVGITANCDRVSQEAALVIGLVAGFLVVMGVIMLEKLRIDDPVGAWPVHGLCGLWGGIATGIFGTIPTTEAGVDLFTRGGFIWVQLYSSAIIIGWAFITMLVLFLVLKAIGLLRVSPEHEHAGLDFSEHRMHAYPGDVAA
ncbi:ammonium transporter [Candidatus Laterigemmans baculatus]|uniref:ammonium transporter n=1 Tax=Candidatus Laterigemmans baculatus TaxID=2770505 RepID=UPI001F46E6CB|nr:ammonium transporter [Candidatus Laterigemmans baculatus]